MKGWNVLKEGVGLNLGTALWAALTGSKAD